MDAGVDRVERGIRVHDEVAVQRVALSRDAPGSADQLDELCEIAAMPRPGRRHDVLLEHHRTEVVGAEVQGQLADVLPRGQP